MHFLNQDSQKIKEVFSPNSLGAIYAGLIFPYLSDTELTQGLKPLYQATAPAGRIYILVEIPSVPPSISQTFLRREKDVDEPYPGWFPNVGYGPYIPEQVRG
jgi:predicted SAM-dependent methyltransferase